MMNLVQPLLETNLFIPHGHCYLWKPELVGLHIVSDALIALAYYSIPLTLFYVVRRRHDLPFTWILLLFSAFIVACGTTHLMEIWTLWHPTYWLAGGMKLITAAISVTTAIALVQIIPKALALPSPAQLNTANSALQQEIAERKRIETELIHSRDLREAIFNESADALFLVDPQTLLTLDCNQRAIELFQAVDKARLIGIEGHTLQRYQFSQAELDEIMAEMKSQGFWSREIEYVTCQGTVFWGNIAAKPITVAEQAVHLVRVTDINARKEAELAVSRLAAIVESSGDAIIGKSLEGMITSWNRGAERLFGYTAAEVIDRPIALLFPPSHADEVAQGLEQIKQGEPVESYDTVRVRKDGQHINIAVTLSPIKDATGRVVGAAKIARDITERKRAEAALRESENRFQAFMNNSPAVAWITDVAGRILYQSQNYSQILQIHQDAIGKTIFDLFTPEIAEEFHRNSQQVTDTNQALEVIEVAPRADGTLGKFLVYKFPLWEPSGECSVGGIAVDITEREQAKEDLRSLNNRLQYLLTHAPVAIFSCKTNGDYGATSMSENVRTLFGYEPQDFLADSHFWANHIHPEDRDRVLANSSQVFATGYHAHDYRFLHGDGEYRWVYNQLQLMRDDAGNPTEMIGYLVDISDRKRAEQALQEQEAFLRAIGDNIPNGYLYQLRRELDGHYRYTYVSAGLERVSGLKPAAVLADSSLMFQLMVAEDLPDLIQAAEASAQNLSVFDVQVRERLPSGESRWLRLCSTPRRLDDGQIVWDGIRLDINDFKHTEETLRQSETRNRALIQALPDLLIRMKQDGTYLDVQKSENVKLLNSSLVTANSNIHTIFPADEAQERMAHVQKALQTRALQVYEYQLRIDGEIQFEEARIIPCGDDEVLVIVRDISKAKRDEIIRKQAEVELELQSIVVRNMAEGVCMVKVSDGMFVYTNPKFDRMFGYDADELIGQHVAIVNYEDRSTNTTELYKALAKTILEQGEAVYEVYNVKKDGTTFWCQATTSVFEHPNYGAVFVVVQQNITERKQSEDQLRDLSNRLTLALKSGSIGTWDWDITVNRLIWDDRMCELYGITPDQFTNIYEDWVNCIHPDDRPLAEAASQQALAGEKDYEHEFRIRHSDGTVRYLKAYARVERNQAGIPHRMIGINYDITELKQTAEQIEASLKEKEVLLKEIHHRVKNNLGIVDGLLQMQARRSQNPEIIETLKESQNRITSIALVHEKLYNSDDLAKINIAHYISDLTAHLFDSYNIHSNQIKLVTHINAIPLAIDLAIPCGLIINELVSNALKYAFSNQQAGEIQVSLEEQQDQSLCLIVQDNGVGFPEDFDLKQTTTLGMSLVQGLVKQLQGTLAIHRQSGTTVTITFPRGQL